MSNIEVKDREILKLTIEELKDIVYEDNLDFIIVKSDIIGTFRHGNENVSIVKRLSDDKFFKLNYRDSIKENCSFEDFNINAQFEEVFLIERLIKDYI